MQKLKFDIILRSSVFLIYVSIYTYINLYTGCPLKKVGAMMGAWKKSRRTKKSYTILSISQ